jgi:hypothetical protein
MSRMSKPIFFSSGLALLAVMSSSARSAHAADPSMSECLAANESAINLRGNHKLRQARDQALMCSASSCPGRVRAACQKRVAELTAAIPTIVLLAKDGAGHDVVAVRVSMDGEPIAERLDGTAIPIDPGEHKFTFQVAGQPPMAQSFVIGEGEKDRRESITVGPVVPSTIPTLISAPIAPARAEAAAPSGAAGSGQRIAGIVVGAVGVVGLGLGGVFGAMAASDWSSAKAACAPPMPASCQTSPKSPGFQEEGSASSKATASTVTFIAGGVLAAGGLVLFLSAPKPASSETAARAPAVEFVPEGGPAGAGFMIRGTF